MRLRPGSPPLSTGPTSPTTRIEAALQAHADAGLRTVYVATRPGRPPRMESGRHHRTAAAELTFAFGPRIRARRSRGHLRSGPPPAVRACAFMPMPESIRPAGPRPARNIRLARRGCDPDSLHPPRRRRSRCDRFLACLRLAHPGRRDDRRSRRPTAAVAHRPEDQTGSRHRQCVRLPGTCSPRCAPPTHCNMPRCSISSSQAKAASPTCSPPGM